MSHDSTELTFVRCPSCRSLVPAVSTRCRMCGATIDGGSKSDTLDGNDKKSRVRQRTMSGPDTQLSDAAQKMRQEEASDFADSDLDDLAGDDMIDENDPLSAFIEEVETDEGSFSDEKRTQSAKNSSASEGENSPTNGQAKQPRVVIESGTRQPGKTSSLSYGKQAGEKFPQSDRLQESVVGREQSWKGSDSTPVSGRGERRERDGRRDEMRPQNDRGMRPNERQQEHRGPSVKAETGEALFGWLVSYAKAQGEATELREGKFFVSRTSLKANDFLMNHPSISTPHALVSVSLEQGCIIQDLMSERGIYIRKRSGGGYQRINEKGTLEHGDWVKFGEVELQLSVAARPD